MQWLPAQHLEIIFVDPSAFQFIPEIQNSTVQRNTELHIPAGRATEKHVVQCFLHLGAMKKRLKDRQITHRIVLLEYLQTTASATAVQNIDHHHEFEMANKNIFAS